MSMLVKSNALRAKAKEKRVELEAEKQKIKDLNASCKELKTMRLIYLLCLKCDGCVRVLHWCYFHSGCFFLLKFVCHITEDQYMPFVLTFFLLKL